MIRDLLRKSIKNDIRLYDLRRRTELLLTESYVLRLIVQRS